MLQRPQTFLILDDLRTPFSLPGGIPLSTVPDLPTTPRARRAPKILIDAPPNPPTSRLTLTPETPSTVNHAGNPIRHVCLSPLPRSHTPQLHDHVRPARWGAGDINVKASPPFFSAGHLGTQSDETLKGKPIP